jgi:hypothetical protein
MLVAVEGSAQDDPHLSAPADTRWGFRQPADGLPYHEERSLQSVLEQEGKLPAYEAIRVLLNICKALHSSGHKGEHPCGLTPETVFFSDSDGSVRVSSGSTALAIQSETACVRNLATILWQMVTGQRPSQRLESGYVPAKLSRLRTIVSRALSTDPQNRYLTLQEFVKDVEREEKVQFRRSLMIPAILLAATLLLWWIR